MWLDNNTTFSNYRSTSPQPGLNNHNALPLGICLRKALQLIWTIDHPVFHDGLAKSWDECCGFERTFFRRSVG